MVAATPISNAYCETCKGSSYSNAMDDSSCVPFSVPHCPAGKGYLIGSASTDASCFTCPKGTFSEENNVSPCTACNAFTCSAGEGYQPGLGYLRANKAQLGGGNLAVEGTSHITGIEIVLGESESGGGVMFYPKSISEFSHVDFFNNAACVSGGALHASEAQVTMDNVLISASSGASAAGIFATSGGRGK